MTNDLTMNCSAHPSSVCITHERQGYRESESRFTEKESRFTAEEGGVLLRHRVPGQSGLASKRNSLECLLYNFDVWLYKCTSVERLLLYKCATGMESEADPSLMQGSSPLSPPQRPKTPTLNPEP